MYSCILLLLCAVCLLVPLSGQNPKTAAHTDEGNGKQEIFVSGMRNAQRVKIILCAANYRPITGCLKRWGTSPQLINHIKDQLAGLEDGPLLICSLHKSERQQENPFGSHLTQKINGICNQTHRLYLAVRTEGNCAGSLQEDTKLSLFHLRLRRPW